MHPWLSFKQGPAIGTPRGLFRNNDLRVPVLNTESTLERVSLSKSQKFAGSAEPVETVLARPLTPVIHV